MLGQIFFLLFFVFSLTCYPVFFFFLLSGISLIMLLCYVLYVNFVIVCYLTFFLPVYVSISVTASVEVGFFPQWPRPPTLSSSAFGKQLRFHRFSLMSFCSCPKVVFLYCNYYFSLFVGIYFHGSLRVKTFADRERVVFLELALARSTQTWID